MAPNGAVMSAAKVVVWAILLMSVPALASRDTIYNYIGAMTAVDSSIFAATTALYNGIGGIQPDNTITYGSRTFVVNRNDTEQSMLTQNTAYRMDTMAELFVAIVAVYLESIGQLPYGLNFPLPPSVLPPYFANESYLNNGGFTSVPITLRAILEHTSTINEEGFMAYAASTPTSTELITNDAFVSQLFDTYGHSLFNPTLQPGISGSFNYSRTNIALATYVLDRQLFLMQSAQGIAEEDVVDVAGYLMDTMLPRIGMSGTFVLSRFGRRSNPSYPPNLSTDWLPYITMQDVDSSGSSVITNRTIHPAYTSDFMIYTTTSDLTMLMAAVLTPGGVFYNSIGARLATTTVSVQRPAIPYVTSRGLGIFNMSFTALCAAMTSVANNGEAPICLYDSRNSPSDTSAYGIFASGEFNQVALLCFPAANGQPWCSASEVTYLRNASNVLSTLLQQPTLAQNWALLLSVASLAEFTSLPKPTSTSTPPTTSTTESPRPTEPSTKNFGLWVTLGVLAVVVIVVAASYVADYFVQPAPPAKIVVPVPLVSTGIADAAAAAAGFNGRGIGVGVGDYAGAFFGARDAVDGLSPPPPLLGAGPLATGGGRDEVLLSAFQRPNTMLALSSPTAAEADEDTATTATATGAGAAHTASTRGRSPGISPDGLRRRHTKQKDVDSMTDPGSSRNNSPNRVERYDGSSLSNSRRPSRSSGGTGSGGSRGIPRFDAYV